MNFFRKLILFFIVVSMFSIELFAGYPGIDWREMELKHFVVLFPDNLKDYAEEVSKIAEQVYPVYKNVYNTQQKGKTIISIWDTSEISNGGTYYNYNFIRIDGIRGFFFFRDTTDWWKNVIPHEYSHNISLKGADPFYPLTPGFLLGENRSENNYDVADELYIPGQHIPRWLAEGIAQTDSSLYGSDRWDSMRDMLLRISLLNNRELKFDRLGTIYDKTSREGELVYNQGFSLVLYLNERFGSNIIAKLVSYMGKNWVIDFNSAFYNVTGLKWETVYDDWRKNRVNFYKKQIDKLGKIINGNRVSQSYYILRKFRKFKGKDWVFLSTNKGGYAPGNLYFGPVTGKNIKSKLIAKEVWDFDISNDDKIFFTASGEKNCKGYRYSHLYKYDIKSEKKKIINSNRYYSINVTEAGLVGVKWNKSLQLCFLTIDGIEKKCKKLPGDEILSMDSSEDKVYMVINFKNKGRIYTYNIENREISTLNFQDRVRELSVNNGYLYFSWDKTGVYNIYSLNLNDNKINKMTNVLGGVFFPYVDNKRLFFSSFDKDGFSIYSQKLTTYSQSVTTTLSREVIKDNSYNYNAKKYKKYKLRHLKPLFYPEMVIAYKKMKLGGTFVLQDALQNHSVNAEFLFGSDMDMRIEYTYDGLVPELHLNGSYYLRNYGLNDSFGNYIKLSRNIYFLDMGANYYYKYPWFFGLYGIYRHIEDNYGLKSYSMVYMQTIETNFTFGYNSSLDSTAPHPRNGWQFWVNISSGHSFLPYKKDDYHYTKAISQFMIYLPVFLKGSVMLRLKGGIIDTKVDTYDLFFLGGGIYYLHGGEFQSEESLPGYDYFLARWYSVNRLSCRFPLWAGERRFRLLTLKGLYFSMFTDIGRVKKVGYFQGQFKLLRKEEGKDIFDYGVEIRIPMLLFYSYNWDSYFSVARSSEGTKYYLGIGIGF